jgi:signal transduction histidine kinase
VTLRADRRNGVAELHVLDRGPGFPPEFLDRAFERFSRGRKTGGPEGSGLGLAIVESIAEAHEGKAVAVNRPEGGADVGILLRS